MVQCCFSLKLFESLERLEKYTFSTGKWCIVYKFECSGIVEIDSIFGYFSHVSTVFCRTRKI